LLALICERVSGRSFAAFCQERIFGPLGMTRTCVNDSIVKIIPGRALGYYDDGQGNWLNAPLTDSVVGPTNVYTTVEDLARWDESFYTGRVAAATYTPGR
jgi:CubicO group peptidase (beta-lactamase class C family)